MRFWKRKKDIQVRAPTRTPADSTKNQPESIQTSTHTLLEVKSTDGQSQISGAEALSKVKENRLGLFILADQDENNRDAIDIVALHGLNGHWEKTWQARTPTGVQVTWLRDFLPQQIPHARIMSFGYDSILQFSKSVADICTFAEQLLEDLMSRRCGLAAKRPIIFICHSLGGIVVKKAIVRAHEKDRYKALLDSIKGIVFFGTPHRGSALASWSTLLSNVASAVTLGTKTNKGLSKDLESQSFVLRDISKSFVDRGRGLQLVSFYETDKMDFLNCRVVEEESAILGFPNEVTIAMSGNHRTMCRFESIDEQRYRYVWTNLQNMAGNAAKENLFEDNITETIGVEDDEADCATETALNTMHGKPIDGLGILDAESVMDVDFLERRLLGESAIMKAGNNGNRHDSSAKRQEEKHIQPSVQEQRLRRLERERRADEKKRREENTKKNTDRMKARKIAAACYRALHNSDYEAHKSRNPAAVAGTCHWLLDHDVYRNWRREQASDILWLSADPGCGKSVLTSYLVDRLKNADNLLHVPEIVCFFFFKEDNNEQDNASHAIAAILHQLYTAQPWLLDHATNAFISEGRAILGDFKTLWSILIASIKDPRSRDILLILDGLDECEPVTRRRLLQSLVSHYKVGHNTLSQPPFVKIIFASRPDNDIKIAFDILPTIRLRGEDEPEAISRDVELVIQDHIEKAVLRGLPKSILGDLKAGLIKGADRTFLWTTMVIDLLEAKRGASKKELLEILHSRNIYRIYHRLLEDSSDQAEARRLLHIVVAAVRPLTLAEMSIAMSVNSAHLSLEDLELDIIHNFEERIKDLCGNFIRIVRSTVYLVHQTARQFLLQENPHQPLSFGKWQHSFVLSEAHSQLLDICLQYLALLNVKSSRPRYDDTDLGTITHQFVDYTGQFWTYHYSQLAPKLTESQLSRCAQLCNSNAPSFALWFKNASRYAHNPNHELREGTMQRDIAFHLGLVEVVQRLDQIMKPSDLACVDDRPTSPTETKANDGHGSRTITTSLKLRDPDQVIQPHTISPSHLRASPLIVAMESRSSLNASLRSRSSPGGLSND